MDTLFVEIRCLVMDVLVDEFSAVELEQLDIEDISTKIALRIQRMLDEKE